MARRRRPVDQPGAIALDVAVTDGYVRRFWTAALGPGAVADLLRLAAAAEGGRSLPRPVHLDALVRTGLVGGGAGPVLIVSDRVPLLPRHFLAALPPALRRSHDEWVTSMV